MAKIRKRNKSKITIDKADRELQDAYRRKYEGKLCEGCTKRLFAVVHHHLPKSRSNAGRYHKDNLIFLCEPCHSEISFNGGSQIIARYSARRGKRWIAKMDNLRTIKRQAYTKGELEKIIKYYQKWKQKKEQQIQFLNG